MGHSSSAILDVYFTMNDRRAQTAMNGLCFHSDKSRKCREQGRYWFNRCLANNVIRDFHRRVKQAGIETAGKNLTVHTLRKCCLQNWADSLPMNTVKELAGHSDIETTNCCDSTVDEMNTPERSGQNW